MNISLNSINNIFSIEVTKMSKPYGIISFLKNILYTGILALIVLN